MMNPELSQPPTHIDRARALRLVLTCVREDIDMFGVAVAEVPKDDWGPTVLALIDSFSKVLQRRLEDPAGYLENWIASELQLADDEGEPHSRSQDD